MSTAPSLDRPAADVGGVLRTAAPPPPALPRIDSGCAGLRLTPEEFDALADYEDGYRYELIQGVLVVTPIPEPGERDSNDELGSWLRTYRRSHAAGRAIDRVTFEEYIETSTGRRRADRAVWVGLGRRPKKGEPPTIAIEFVSRSKRDWLRDYVEKRDEYLAAGVKEYWVIDRFRRTLTVYRAAPDGFSELVIGEQDSYRPELLPGFEFPLREILAEADQAEEREA